MVSMQDV